MYTDDAMISVLQKIKSLFREGKTSCKLIQEAIEGDDEMDCFRIADKHKYFQLDSSGNLGSNLTETAQKELHRLLTIKKDRERQDQQYGLQVQNADTDAANLIINRRRDQRKFWHFVLTLITLGIAIAALFKQ